MKHITAAIAILFSLASITNGYQFDPARDKRAKDFYKGLVLTQIDQFNPNEDTQFFGKQVGGQVCAAVDEYAVFEFSKLNKFTVKKEKPQAYQVLQAGDSNDGPAKLALVYQLCGKDFTPDASKLNTENSAAMDSESCKKLAANTDTVGNMYLLKDGKCVQSFHNADFDATVEQLEDKKTKQEWSLTYTSKQACAADKEKQFVVKFEGVCVGKDTPTTLETGALDSCEAKVKYTSEGACYIQYLPLAKYQAMIAPFTGAIFIVVGALMCFLGSKFLPYVIGFLACLAVTGVCSLIGFNFLDAQTAQMWHFGVLIAAALAFGILAGLAAWKLAKEWGVAILAFWLGIMIALLVLKIAQVEKQNITLGAAAAGGLLGAWLGRSYNAGIKKFGTAIIGSFILIRGVSLYLGNFPSEFDQGKIEKAVSPESGEVLYYTIGYLVAFIILSFLGALFQFRKLEDDGEEDDAFKGEDEGRCCGLF